MLKAAYVLWASFHHIERLINSGVNMILVPDYNTPPVPFEIRQLPSHTRTVEILEKFNGRAKMVIVPIWFQNWFDLPQEQRFVDSDGVKWTRTPCPTSLSYMNKRFGRIRELSNQGLISGVVWDLEDYEAPGVHKFFAGNSLPRCYCARCSKMRAERTDIDLFFNSQFRARMNGYEITGFMPYSGKWVVDLFPRDAIWFCERTYSKYKYWDLWKKKRDGLKSPSLAGVWIEKHRDIAKYSREVMKRRPRLFGMKCGFRFDGVWFYTHSRFHTTTQFIKCPGPYCGPLTDVDYAAIREL